MAMHVGFFGKLPATGDFVRRGLPQDFIQCWDGAFQHALAAARQRTGADWDTSWRAAPVWRFLLPSGVCGASAWAGVMGPSRDRVGRGFPMVMAAPFHDAPDVAHRLLCGGRWFASLSALYRHAQADTAYDAPRFGLAVDNLSHVPVRDVTDGLWRTESPTGCIRLPLSDAMPYAAVLQDAWRQLATRAGSWCLWWSDDDAASPTLVATRGLPDDYGMLLDASGATEPRRSGEHTIRLAAPPAPVVTGDALTDAVRSEPVLRLDDQQMTVVCADDAADDNAGRAASAIRAAARRYAGGIDALRGALLALHPLLRTHGDDPAHGRVDAAVVAMQWSQGRARLMRIGAAAAWHWRRGQIRPVFASSTLRGEGSLDDLLFGPAGPVRPGLGGALPPHVDEATCAVQPGDRLLLLATRTLCSLPEAWFADALDRHDVEDARQRLAHVAGLRSDTSTWPIGLIDIPT